MKTVYIQEIDNPKEREILKLLKANGACLYGDIFRQLSISASEGQHIIFSLLSRGLIKYQYRSSNIELNVELR
jgi:DNA-binding Lrp family transcriptional regulator